MKRMTQILSLGLLLSISTLAFAGHGDDRNHRKGHYDGHHHYARHSDRHYSKRRHHGKRHHVKNHRHARRHSHHGRYCHDWHPRGYIAPRVVYGYSSPGLVIVYEPSAGIYIGGGY